MTASRTSPQLEVYIMISYHDRSLLLEKYHQHSSILVSLASIVFLEEYE